MSLGKPLGVSLYQISSTAPVVTQTSRGRRASSSESTG
jgi:hypothetical protein